MKKSFKWIFALSLTANVFFIGFLAGRDMPLTYPPQDSKSEAPIERLMDQFAAEARAPLQPKFQDLRATRQELGRLMRQGRDVVFPLLEAPVFDKDAFIQAAQQADAPVAEEKKKLIAQLADLASTMTLDERQKMAGYFRKPFGMMPDGRHRHPMRRGGPPFPEQPDMMPQERP